MTLTIDITTVQWLENNAPGFQSLLPAEREAIAQFLFLWSLFENEALGGRGNWNTIKHLVTTWGNNALLSDATFSIEILYFRNRYYENGEFTYRLDHLHFERSGNPRVVFDVLSGKQNEPHNICEAVLLIVFRLRNNLFHGEKWVYELREQDENFTHANSTLIQAIELNRRAADNTRVIV